MDFTYIYSAGQKDFAEFSGGKPFTEQEVYAEIGRPEEWTHRHAPPPTKTRTDEQAAGRPAVSRLPSVAANRAGRASR